MKKVNPHGETIRKRGDIFPGKRRLLVYARKWWAVASDAAVLLFVIALLYAGLLYLCRVVWNLYLATYTGQMFVAHFPEEAAVTFHLMQMDFIECSVRITIYAFCISTVAGAVCRFSNLRGRLYDPFGFPGRSVVCGLPLTALVAYGVRPVYDLPTWGAAFVVVLFPTFCVYGRCFDYARRLTPTWEDVKRWVGRIDWR